MNLKQALKYARDILAAVNIENTALESEVLLMYVLKIDRVQLYTDMDKELPPEQEKAFQELVKRCLDGEPSAYITGSREFFGLDFFVDPAVLIPRPETELLVETAVNLAKERAYKTIVDAGTGSGAVAICLALNLPEAIIYATDISASALDVAAVNYRKHGIEDRITFLEGDILAPLPEPVDMVVANLPYIQESELQTVNTHGYEPSIALNGGEDGLEEITKLVSQSLSKLLRGGAMVLEIGEGQSNAVSRQLKGIYPYAGLDILPDLAGIERVVRFTLPSNTHLDS